jgi:HD-GYP domain-containing protein (c-di-GMP phosphodiesterase class II)
VGANDNDSEYFPIRISTLRGDQVIPFDLFIKVAGKQILYCRQGDAFDGQRLARLKDKKIKQLYILAGKETDYRGYLSRNIQAAAAADIPFDKRVEVVQGLAQAATEEVLEEPTSKLHYEVFKEDTRRYVEFILKENEALRHVLAMPNPDANLAQHGVNVATIATCLAAQSGITDMSKLQLLAVGCLLHDLEHVHSGLNVARPLTKFNDDETVQYRSHPDAGVARVQNTQFYDQTVLKIMRHHHECTNGSGFPDGLKENDMDPLILFAGIADSYDRLITYEGMQPKDAVKQLLIEKVGLLPLNLIKGLGQLLRTRGVAV